MADTKPTVRKALKILGLEVPKVSRGDTQEKINQVVAEWKKTTLKSRYHELLHEHHPDKNDNSPESNEKFKEIRAAYNVIRTRLQVQIPAPPPSEAKTCPHCSASRVPEDAIHCHECGKKYALKEDRCSCPACNIDREPAVAKFCHGCGYDYQVPDPILNILRSEGISESQIRKMEERGVLQELREMGPLSPQFRSKVALYSRLEALWGQ